MTGIDYAFIAVIVISTLFSLLRGFVKEAISLGSWIIAMWVSSTFASNLSNFMPQSIENPAFKMGLAFIILFVATLVLGVMVNILLNQIINKTGLSSVDRALGTAFGLARGILIVTVFVMLASLTSIQEQDIWKDSDLVDRFQALASWLQVYLPDNISKNLPG
ncbi:MAG: CvpA family protein [Gammaproteobacteria bacterium]|nr:CvpA family protein [Gammaproteobacteria bacterium]